MVTSTAPEQSFAVLDSPGTGATQIPTRTPGEAVASARSSMSTSRLTDASSPGTARVSPIAVSSVAIVESLDTRMVAVLQSDFSLQALHRWWRRGEALLIRLGSYRLIGSSTNMRTPAKS